MSILALALSLAAASPSDACAGLVVQAPGAAERRDAAALVTGTGQPTDAASVGTMLAADPWLLIWATPREAERGVFFFHSDQGKWRLVDVWGGVAPPEERGDVAAWARGLPGDPPAALADCFAERVTAGE